MDKIKYIIFILLAIPLYSSANTDVANYVKASSQTLYALDNAAISVTATSTWEAWIKMSGLPQGTATKYGIMGHSDTSGLQDAYNFSIDGNDYGTNLLELFITGSPTSNTRYSYMCNALNDATQYDGKWIHVAATFSSDGTIGFFLNGVAATSTCIVSGAARNINDSTSKFSVGSDYNTLGYFFNGRIYLARLWSVLRTASQISTNYCNALGATTGLQGEWTLDNSLLDNSGNGTTLTNSNSVTFPVDTPSACQTVTATAQNIPFLIFDE